METMAVLRALHVLAVVHWIGGVAMVTLVILPAVIARFPPEGRLAVFEAVEHRFAAQARVSTALAGLSGFWMLWESAGWDRLADAGQWWLILMVAVWALFSFVLFLAEPLFLHRWFREAAETAPERTLARVLRLHRVLLAVSAIAVAGGVMGAHGGL